MRKDFQGLSPAEVVIAEMSTHLLCKRLHYVLSVDWIHTRVFLRPVLLQDYFGTGLRYYFVAGAEIVPQKGVCNRNKTSA
jgi:hypothetical protein